MKIGTLISFLLLVGASGLKSQVPAAPRDLTIGAGKSLVLDSPVDVQRVSVANGDVLEAVAISPREVLVNGKRAGETSLILWQAGGNRLLFEVRVRETDSRLEAVRRQMSQELPGQQIEINRDKDVVFLRGTVKDMVSAERAAALAGALGKTVNLLRVATPPSEMQVLLKVRFANVDRAVGSELGANIFSTGATNTIGSVTTQQFNPPKLETQPNQSGGVDTKVTLSDALNIFLFRPDLNLGATIRALQTRRLLEILAEPNLLAINGKQASFLAGGEYPYPTVQGGATGGLLAITIQFREFGIKLNFTPTVTPRGTIRLDVAPEVSSLDFANGLVYQGFNIPALSTRRVQTEIELESGQSFAIAGLLDNRVAETLNKVPGLANIPLLGKIFQSRILNKNKSELLVVVTPEIVRPIPAGQPVPEVRMPKTFLDEGAPTPPRTPGMDATGPVPVKPVQDTVPVEQLLKEQQQQQAAPSTPPIQLVPVPMLAPSMAPAAGTPPAGSTGAPANMPYQGR